MFGMGIEYIKDGNGQIIGSKNGDWIRDKSGRQIARFNEGTNQTLTADGKRFGQGNQLTAALKSKGK